MALAQIKFFDANNDGSTDVMWLTGNNQPNQLYVSSGAGWPFPPINDAAMAFNPNVQTPVQLASASIRFGKDFALLMRIVDYVVLVRAGSVDVKTGRIGMAVVAGANSSVALSAVVAPQLTSFVDGYGAAVNISYSTLADPTVHTPTPPSAAAYPLRGGAPVTQTVVAAFGASDGVGGTSWTAVTYAGYLRHLQVGSSNKSYAVHKSRLAQPPMQGLGPLGFASSNRTDIAKNQIMQTWFSQVIE